jgi:hypothetical protein
VNHRSGDNTPVVKVELKRADAYELIHGDKEKDEETGKPPGQVSNEVRLEAK